MKKMMIGVCTYNRKNIIEYTAKSFGDIEGIKEQYIKVYDDNSTEYDKEYLKSKYPMAEEVIVNKENLGANFNTRQMFIDFLNSDREYLFIADSDLVFNTDILTHIENGIEELEKKNELVIFSMFNTPSHDTIEEFSDRFVIKNEIGSAGTIISKEAVKKIIKNEYKEKVPFDRFYCNELKKEGAKIFCSKNSYVQHIGIIGQNSFFDCVDMGINFKIDTLDNAKAIVDIMQNTFVWNNVDVEDMLFKYCERGRIGIRTLIKCIALCLKYKRKNY